MLKAKFISQKELGKIPNIKTDIGLKRLFSKIDKHGNSKDYDFFLFKGFLYQAESIGWDYPSYYISCDADAKIETEIYFDNDFRLFKCFNQFELLSWRNDIVLYTTKKVAL